MTARNFAKRAFVFPRIWSGDQIIGESSKAKIQQDFWVR